MPQKVLLLTNTLSAGGRFVVGETDVPAPGPGHVLVEVHATALNPMEAVIADTGAFVPKWPTSLGFDAAGVVAKLGEAVAGFVVGDRVMHSGTFAGSVFVTTYQQYVVMSVDYIAKVPQSITLDQAATIPSTAATAAFGLYHKKQTPFGGIELTPPWEGGRGKYAGEPIVIIAGATNVGQHTIQFAKLSGFSPIITTASPHNEAYLKSLGATHVIDRSLPLAAHVRAITDKPVQYGYDAISLPETQDALYDLLAPGGRLLLVKHTVAIDPAKLAAGDKYVGCVFADPQAPGMQDIGRTFYAHLAQLVEAGDIKPTRLEVLPNGLAGIPDGLQRLKQGVSALKLVARPQETP
ncbi:zinc-binding alcohol dehydrogenase family protein [Phanerochaete sordida]|uniref:Zinc-binding alcohol dehydrogenase family protein n=1 Tax=Phanerochaete sordida TaxID=48140 RepID=A0A9P3G9F0_9APHY|nr:zinc-binding alcohol dehydrogenase family protein [Phanerochaete sordida]